MNPIIELNKKIISFGIIYNKNNNKKKIII